MRLALIDYKTFKEFKKQRISPSQFDILQAKPKHTFQRRQILTERMYSVAL